MSSCVSSNALNCNHFPFNKDFVNKGAFFNFLPLTISGLPAFHHVQVAVWSDGVFQAASALALEEHHIPQEKQGGHILTSQKRTE